jgi:HSP20 family molecular chaperone IbpA
MGFAEIQPGRIQPDDHFSDSIDAARITTTYVDGVLEVSLPSVEGRQQPLHNIPIG